MKKIVIILTIIFILSAGYFLFNKEEAVAPTEEEEETEEKTAEEKEEFSVKIFFSNSELNSQALCEQVFPVDRTVESVEENLPATVLKELLKGPSEEEEAAGYFTNINQGVELNSLKVDQGKAIADFNQQMEFQLGGSCRVTAIRAEIEETLKQFSQIEEVIISIEGETEGVLQP